MSKKQAEVEEAPQTPDERASDTPQLFGVIPFPVPWKLYRLVMTLLRLTFLYYLCREAYEIRLYAIKEYGPIIHEFDPWFNYRATEYLEANGWEKFFKWFDYMSWYPLGRPVGTTIYPGMQISSVLIYRALNYFGYPMSLNDVCAYVPAWFGVAASLLLGLVTYESYGSLNGGIIAAAIYGIIPAHIMRSVGGGYDNESVAMTAMCATFYFWVRSLRSERHWPVGIIAGVVYTYMVSAWGGYIFVVNMIAFHAFTVLFNNLALNRHSSILYRAYTLFYIVGTIGATRIPVVGWAPLKSLEQIFPLILFIVFQLLELCHYISKKRQYYPGSSDEFKMKFYVFGVALGIGLAVAAILYPGGFFGPVSARVRGLFLQHTRTGNPLVDSVAEHQPASEQAFKDYLSTTLFLIPVGILFLVLNYERWVQCSFVVWYTLVAFFFATKMNRLLLLLGPVASATSGIALGAILDWTLKQFVYKPTVKPANSTKNPNKDSFFEVAKKYYHSRTGYFMRLFVALCIVYFFIAAFIPIAQQFRANCHTSARRHSSPQIVFKSNGRVINDYVDAYYFLRDRTPKSARVMAWWDYGYQITGIGQRTTIADGNTWNHEHIATLGYCLTSPTKKAHTLIRHLADYVLLWGGGHGDDLAKSPHMARIGNSVYNDLCPDDPTCRSFGFYSMPHKPTPMMAKSLLFNLLQDGITPGATVDKSLFTLVHSSKHGLVRIYKVENVSRESKLWLADPANRKCDAPGSWYCVGQYPPVKPIQDLLARKNDFKQLEDFNRGQSNEKYQKQYMEKMEKFDNPGKSAKKDSPQKEPTPKKETIQKKPVEVKKEATQEQPWQNTEETTRMWQLIHNNEFEVIQGWLREYPESVSIRSEDGRGPLWWAYEEGNTRLIELFIAHGAAVDERDAKGLKPVDLKKK